MKKFILFLGFLYVISFFSCQQKSNKESFADIIKNDSSRVQELLDEAALLNKAGVQQNKSINPTHIDPLDELTTAELDSFRAQYRPRPNHNDKKDPTVIVSAQAVQELIGEHPGEKDSLIFYLGKYPRNDRKRIDRYNDRNVRAGGPKYDYPALGPRITFAIQSQKMDTSSGKFKMSRAYDVGRLCPPPSTGCF